MIEWLYWVLVALVVIFGLYVFMIIVLVLMTYLFATKFLKEEK